MFLAIILSALLIGLAVFCVYSKWTHNTWFGLFSTVLIVVSLLYSAGHAAFTPDAPATRDIQTTGRQK
jgi:hypothetical protein